MWTTSNGYIKKCLEVILYLSISVQHLWAFMNSISILQTSFSVFTVPSKTNNRKFCILLDGTVLLRCFVIESEISFWVVWVFLLVWLCFGFGVFFMVFSWCSPLFFVHSLWGSWWITGLARTSVGSSGSTWHRTTLSLFEVYLMFCLKKS